MVPPGRACVKPPVDCRRRKEISHVESTAYESEGKTGDGYAKTNAIAGAPGAARAGALRPGSPGSPCPAAARKRFSACAPTACPRSRPGAASSPPGSTKVQPWRAFQSSASRRVASDRALDARLATRTHGRIRKRGLPSTRSRRLRRAASSQPMKSAARQRPGRVGEQQAAQPAPAAIDDGVTQMRTDRAAVAQVMVPVDQFVPSREAPSPRATPGAPAPPGRRRSRRPARSGRSMPAPSAPPASTRPCPAGEGRKSAGSCSNQAPACVAWRRESRGGRLQCGWPRPSASPGNNGQGGRASSPPSIAAEGRKSAMSNQRLMKAREKPATATPKRMPLGGGAMAFT